MGGAGGYLAQENGVRLMPIYGICGLPGAGKTYLAARTMLRMRARDPDRFIVSNTPLYLPGTPVPVIDTIDEAFDLEGCELLLDEVHLWLDAREWQRHTGRYSQFVSQLRKRDINLWFTSQSIESVDKLLRDRVFITHYCESFQKLGFFWQTAYFGAKADKAKKYYSKFYLFNPLVARVYRHEYEVKV